ncbi:MAG: outer membrane beta-barrel protein [Bacteroidetes bacterium]|nr:outer membrane beta-barrel protein [Bacteroidota bacterium]
MKSLLLAALLFLPSAFGWAGSGQFVNFSLSGVAPGGPVARSLGADKKMNLGFTLAYLGEITKHLTFGAGASYSRTQLGMADTNDYSAYAMDVYQLELKARWRFIKHGFSPFIGVDAGASFLSINTEIGGVNQKVDGLGEVRPMAAFRAGVLFPVSDQVDLDVHGRFSWTFIDQGYSTSAIHVGMVYELPER